MSHERNSSESGALKRTEKSVDDELLGQRIDIDKAVYQFRSEMKQQDKADFEEDYAPSEFDLVENALAGRWWEIAGYLEDLSKEVADVVDPDYEVAINPASSMKLAHGVVQRYIKEHPTSVQADGDCQELFKTIYRSMVFGGQVVSRLFRLPPLQPEKGHTMLDVDYWRVLDGYYSGYENFNDLQEKNEQYLKEKPRTNELVERMAGFVEADDAYRYTVETVIALTIQAAERQVLFENGS